MIALTTDQARAIAAFLDQVASEATETFDIGRRLSKPQPDDPEVPETLRWPFDYELLMTDDPRINDQGPYDIQIAVGDRTYPPYLEEVSSDTLALWDVILHDSTHPLVVGRLADLLWIRRYGQRPYDYALRACRSLVDGTESIAEPIRRIEALQRATSIALSVGNEELQAEAADALNQQLEEAIREDNPLPGVVFGAIDGLDELPAEFQSPLVSRSLNLLVEKPNDPWIVTAALDRLATRAEDQDERERLQRSVVQAWLDGGDQAEDISRLVFYERAYGAAERYGLADLRDSVQAVMQRRSVDESELKRIRSEAQLPGEFIEWMEQFADVPDWPAVLLRLIDFGPLAGDPEQTRKSVSEEMHGSLSATIPTKVLGPEGSLITEIPAGPDGLDARVRQRRAFHATYLGQLMTNGLAKAAESLGEPNLDNLTGFFNSGLAAESAEVFARAVIHHAAGRFDEAIHILYPRIELALRNAAREIGLVVLRQPRGLDPGGVKSMGSIIASLSDAMSEPWRVTFDTILTDPLGLNLRNVYAHGLAGLGSPLASTLLIYVAVSFSQVFGQETTSAS